MSSNVSPTARIVFRLTPEERRQLAARARREHRGLASLVSALVHEAIIRDTHQRQVKTNLPTTGRS